MSTIESQAVQVCRSLDHLCVAIGDRTIRDRADKALRLLTVSQIPLAGKPEGWAAGIVYALVNRDCRACGIPGLLNSDVETLLGVTMGTIRRRAAQVTRAMEI